MIECIEENKFVSNNFKQFKQNCDMEVEKEAVKKPKVNINPNIIALSTEYISKLLN